MPVAAPHLFFPAVPRSAGSICGDISYFRWQLRYFWSGSQGGMG